MYPEFLRPSGIGTLSKGSPLPVGTRQWSEATPLPTIPSIGPRTGLLASTIWDATRAGCGVLGAASPAESGIGKDRIRMSGLRIGADVEQ